MDQSLLSGPGPRPRQPTHNNLGTINGCYIPCLLNILGAPLFLFVGFAVGMMGWVGALGLFFFSVSSKRNIFFCGCSTRFWRSFSRLNSRTN